MIDETAAGTPRGKCLGSEPASLIGTRHADFIKASGHGHRIERPDA